MKQAGVDCSRGSQFREGPTSRAESIMQSAVSGVHFGGIASIVPDGGVIGALTEPFPPQGTIVSPSASRRLAVLRPHKEEKAAWSCCGDFWYLSSKV